MIPDITDREFEHIVEQSAVPVLVEFWKPGCGSCLGLLRQLERLQGETTGKLTIFKMNVEDNFQIPAELEISSLPALALYREGRFARFVGGIGTKEEILKQIALL